MPYDITLEESRTITLRLGFLCRDFRDLVGFLGERYFPEQGPEKKALVQFHKDIRARLDSLINELEAISKEKDNGPIG